MNISFRLFLALVFLSLLGACSGGGGGGSNAGNSQLPEAAESPSAVLTKDNTKLFLGSVVDASILNELVFSSLVDTLNRGNFAIGQSFFLQACIDANRASVEYSNGNRTVDIELNNCILSSVALASGQVSATLTNNEDDSYTSQLSYSNLTIARGVTRVSEYNGDVEVLLTDTATSRTARITTTLEASTLDGDTEYILDEIVQTLDSGEGDNLISNVFIRGNYSGWVEVPSHNRAQLLNNSLKGSTRAYGRLTPIIYDRWSYLKLEFFDEDGDDYSDAGVLLVEQHLEDGTIDFFNSENIAPQSGYQYRPPFRRTVDFGDSTQFGYAELFTDYNGDLLTPTVRVRDGINRRPVDLEVTYLGYDRISVEASIYGHFEIGVTAQDASGATTGQVVGELSNPDIRDTDGDGSSNQIDNDDDNDGIKDYNDAFPLDPQETRDTDGDGIGNNSDTDDDNDDVIDSEDFYPYQAACSGEYSGDGERCYLEGPLVWRTAFVSSAGYLHIVGPDPNAFLRWDSNTQQFLSPLAIPNANDYHIVNFVYLEKHNLLFFVIDPNRDSTANETKLMYFDLDETRPSAREFLPGVQFEGYVQLIASQDNISITRRVYTAGGEGSEISVYRGEDLSLVDSLTASGRFARYVPREYANLIVSGVRLSEADGFLEDYELDLGPDFPYIYEIDEKLVSPDGSFYYCNYGNSIIEISTATVMAKGLNSDPLDGAIDATWSTSGLVRAGYMSADFTDLNPRTLGRVALYDQQLNLVSTIDFPDSTAVQGVYRNSVGNSELVLVRRVDGYSKIELFDFD